MASDRTPSATVVQLPARAAPGGHRPSGPLAVPRKVLVVARHTSALLVRSPGTVIAYSIMSMVLLTVLRPMYERLGALDGPAINQEAPGIAVMFTLLALDVAGQVLLSERIWGTWDRLRADSIGRPTVLVGKALPLTVLFTVQQAVLFAFAGLVYGFDLASGSWRLALLTVAWGWCVSCLGLALGVWVRTQGQLAAAADVGALAITCLSGSLVPLAILPQWVSDVAPWTPGYWALRGFQSAVTGDHAMYVRSLVVILGLSLLALLLASLRAPRASR